MTSELPIAWAPDSCTLPTPERPVRAAEFSSLFATALRSLERIDRRHLRLLLAGEAGLVPLVADLTARETECCSFFEFAITNAADAIQLDVFVPDSYAEVLDGLAEHARSAAGLAA
ncbi:MAG TPA: hypothetical protein VE442_19455 [Jatrophihabitans sp.]|jgi:hypothetical protein|nr:hypothetical protein [Jatrophihabitans sp.]